MAFIDQPSLTFLDVSNSNIHLFPNITKSSESINELNISNNKIVNYPTDLNLKKLDTFNGSHNELDDSIFKDLSNANNIKTMILNNNNIAKVPESIENFNALEFLDLSSNKLTEINNNFYYLTKIENLNISQNPNLYIKIIQFYTSPIECNLEKVNVLCYEIGACTSDYTQFKICTKDEIAKLSKHISIGSDEEFSLYTKVFFGMCIVLIIIYGMMIVYVYKMNLNQRRIMNQGSNTYSTVNNNDDILPSYQDALKASQSDLNDNTPTNTTNNGSVSRLPSFTSLSESIELELLNQTTPDPNELPTYEEVVDNIENH